eukprot:TRINITY_DN4395_c0_g1_i1.p1 TRINITY_DN4395_c0_g1~~TRINITY_DN4395_c0_g1_i1.p1  ORF type:complete len:821 (+),score=188.59 TRINITY_DN4395_c0_g1_i1:105-2465(+)
MPHAAAPRPTPEALAGSGSGPEGGDVRRWLLALLPASCSGTSPLCTLLKDGTVLCEMINTVKPGTIPKVNKSVFVFKQAENIENFLKASKEIGFTGQLFKVNDLSEPKNVEVVRAALESLAIFICAQPWYHGPRYSAPPLHLPRVSGRNRPGSVCVKDSQNFERKLKRKSVHPVWTTAEMKTDVSEGVKLQNTSLLMSPRRTTIAGCTVQKLDSEVEDSIRAWFCQLLNMAEPPQTLFASLRDGVILCQALNTIWPGAVPKIHLPAPGAVLTAPQMEENASLYLAACVQKLGMPHSSVFSVDDLCKGKNQIQVFIHIQALAKLASQLPSYVGPEMTVELSQEAEKQLLKWVNDTLHTRNISVVDPAKDFCNGLVLIGLLEELCGNTVALHEKTPTLLWHRAQNAILALRFLSDNFVTPLPCSMEDIVGGHTQPIFKLLLYIKQHMDTKYILATIPSSERRRRFVAERLLNAERAYVKRLTAVFEDVIAPLRQALHTQAHIVSGEELSAVFANLDAILLHHATLLLHIEERLAPAAAQQPLLLGDVFTTKMGWLKAVYSEYVPTFENCFPLVQSLRVQNLAFQALLQKVEDSWGRDLDSVLALPVHHVFGYARYISDLLVCTSAEHADYQPLQAAKQNVQQVVDIVTDCKQLAENNRKLQFIEDSMSGDFTPLTGVYIREGFMDIADAGVQSSYFFLFSDRLVFTIFHPAQYPTGKEFEFQAQFWLEDIEEVADNAFEEEDLKEAGASGYAIEVVTSEYSLILLVKTEHEKKEWVRALQETTQVYRS